MSPRTRRLPGALRQLPSCAGAVGGQALVEGMVGLAVLVALFWAVPLVGRYQDMALTSVLGSGHAAFLSTRDAFTPAELAQAVVPGLVGEAPGRWRDAAGRPLLAGAQITQRRIALADPAQPGGRAAQGLRRDWGLEDTGIRIAAMTVQARDLTGSPADRLSFTRGTAVLVDAGHAASPAQVQARVAQQRPGWQAAQGGSSLLAQTVGLSAWPVDAAWSRPRAGTDWVSAWADQVPGDRLTRRR